MAFYPVIVPFLTVSRPFGSSVSIPICPIKILKLKEQSSLPGVKSPLALVNLSNARPAAAYGPTESPQSMNNKLCLLNKQLRLCCLISQTFDMLCNALSAQLDMRLPGLINCACPPSFLPPLPP